ncbi:MAG: ATP synthase F1 subunit delta [Acidobacteriaceae bacterium]
MKYSANQYAQALHEALQSTNPKDEDVVLDNFVKSLVENNDLRLFPAIEDELYRLELKDKGKTLAHVTSARPLDKQAESKVISKLNELTKGDVVIKKKIDESLIGGVIIQMEDTVIDASVQGSLKNLKDNLKE